MAGKYEMTNSSDNNSFHENGQQSPSDGQQIPDQVYQQQQQMTNQLVNQQSIERPMEIPAAKVSDHYRRNRRIQLLDTYLV